MQQIEEKYGADGKKALLYLDKIKLIETQWTTGSNGPEKAYHTYYSSVQINLIGSMADLSDIIYATTMSYDELSNYENKIISMMENNSIFIGDAIDKLGVSQTFLKGIINRSSVLQIKGYKIEKVADI